MGSVGRCLPPRGSVAARDAERRQLRWAKAAATLGATTEARSRFDHRAALARLVGVFVGEETGVLGSQAELLVAIQPDRGGRKLLFLDAVDGRTLGFIELEAAQQVQVGDSDIGDSSSALRGMLVAEESRGKGYATLFVAIWLRLCLRAGVRPATTRINKPLLALTLIRLGFTPLRGQRLAALTNEQHLRGARGVRGVERKRAKGRQRPLAVEVSEGSEGRVMLYSPLPAAARRLQTSFSATELRSQRLVVTTDPPQPRGRVAHIRVRYAPPAGAARRCAGHATAAPEQPTRSAGQLVHAPLAEASLGGRLRLFALQGPACGAPSATEQAEMLRVLTGQLEHPRRRRPTARETQDPGRAGADPQV